MHIEDQTFATLFQKKFSEIRAQEILPSELIALVEQVLPLQRQATEQAHVLLPLPEACASVTAMFAGSPLLMRKDFPYDLGQALALLPVLLDLLAAAGGESEKAAQTLRTAFETGELAPEAALRALPEGDDALLAAWRSRMPASPRALDFLVTSALSPSLQAASRSLAERLPKDLPHEHGHCPLCGSLPYISLLRDKEGKRYGVCSFCGFEHRIRRIACPFCDEADQGKLKLFRVAEYPGVRVDVCDTCNMYIKTLDQRELDGPQMPALDDMATVALDVLAMGQGFKRPTLSAWGF